MAQTEQKSYERIVFIDILKSIACLCVLVGHVINGMLKDGMDVSAVLRTVNSYVYLFHVPCFFFASGYLYDNRRPKTWDGYFRFIIKKLIALGLPYFVCSIAYVLFSSVMSSDMHTAYSFDAIMGLWVSPVAQYWYLYALFEIFVIVPLVELICGRIDRRWILLVSVVCALLVRADTVCIDYIMMYTCFFYMGAYCNQTDVVKKDFFAQKSAVHLLFAGCALSIAVYAAYQMIVAYTDFTVAVNYALRGLTRMLLVITVVWISYAVSRMQNGASRFLIWLSKYSLYIYLFHTWFTGTLRVLLRKAGAANSWVQTVSGIAVGLAGSLAAAVIIRKVSFFRFWFEPFSKS